VAGSLGTIEESGSREGKQVLNRLSDYTVRLLVGLGQVFRS
jgi:hypothetical protein